MNELFVVTLKGNSRDRGEQHGRQLKAPIQHAVDFYFGFFRDHLRLDAAEVRRRASNFIEPAARASDRLMAEYEGIAAGSGQRIEDIFTLSARYEITFEEFELGECSNVFVGPERSANGHTLLGQNWDWRPEVMDFRAVLLSRCDDQPDHLMITECGQPGKYGFNDHGVGVAAAGLNCTSKSSTGDQLFVVLGRLALETATATEAVAKLEAFGPRATVNVLVADQVGNAVDFEATPKQILREDLKRNGVYWHTNHCRQVDEPCSFENSLARGQRWQELTSGPDKVDATTVQSWLADHQPNQHSICQVLDPSLPDTPSRIQTLSSIVMDLNERRMWASDGPSCQTTYQEFSLSK